MFLRVLSQALQRSSCFETQAACLSASLPAQSFTPVAECSYRKSTSKLRISRVNIATLATLDFNQGRGGRERQQQRERERELHPVALCVCVSVWVGGWVGFCCCCFWWVFFLGGGGAGRVCCFLLFLLWFFNATGAVLSFRFAFPPLSGLSNVMMPI